MAKIKKVVQQVPEEETPLTKAINEFLAVLSTIPWNYGISQTEHKACESLIRQVNGFANHFGFEDLIR